MIHSPATGNARMLTARYPISKSKHQQTIIMPAKNLILQLQLIPHPEGGYFRRTYISNQITLSRNGKERHISTAIYYLLEKEDKSRFHRIQSDELWFFHQGEPLEIILIRGNEPHSIFLGNNIENGELPQAVIPANTWFAARLKKGIGYTLVSCMVSPGFDFADFELADREALLQQYPDLAALIKEFT